MGNQIDACHSLVRADDPQTLGRKAATPAASPRSERKAPPRTRISRKSITDPGNAQRAKDAVYLRDFVEKIENQCASLAEVSAVFGTGRTDKQRFEEVLRERFGYTDSAVIERLYVCTDFLDDGAISHFELTHLFSAPALVRNLWKQLKGRSPHAFVMYCQIHEEGSITKAAFQKFLMDELRYHSTDLIDYLFGLLDLDGDGLISWEEFEKFWAELKPDSKTVRKSHNKMSAYWLREDSEQPSSPGSKKASPRTGKSGRRMQTAPLCTEARDCNASSQMGTTKSLPLRRLSCPEN